MKNIRGLIAKIGKELQRAENIDVETRAALRDLHNDAEKLARPDDAELEPLLDTVKTLESRFAVRHPVLEQMARELADAISKMGI